MPCICICAIGVAEDAAPRRPSDATLLTVIEIIATYVPQYRRQLGSFPVECELLVAPERIQVNTSGQSIDVVVVADLVAIQNANFHSVVRLVGERRTHLNRNLNIAQFEILILNFQDIILGSVTIIPPISWSIHWPMVKDPPSDHCHPFSSIPDTSPGSFGHYPTFSLNPRDPH